MKRLQTYEEFIKRLKILAGIKPKKYLVKITFETRDSLLEHECLTKFQNSTNKYLFHSEKTSPQVRAHYHVYPSNGKNEIYAVNLDGTAHHKKNRGYTVPKKEADELKVLGVAIKDNRVIETFDYLDNGQKQLITESINLSTESVYLLFEE